MLLLQSDATLIVRCYSYKSDATLIADTPAPGRGCFWKSLVYFTDLVDSWFFWFLHGFVLGLFFGIGEPFQVLFSGLKLMESMCYVSTCSCASLCQYFCSVPQYGVNMCLFFFVLGIASGYRQHSIRQLGNMILIWVVGCFWSWRGAQHVLVYIDFKLFPSLVFALISSIWDQLIYRSGNSFNIVSWLPRVGHIF